MYVYAPDLPIDYFSIMQNVETLFWELRSNEGKGHYPYYPMSSDWLRSFIEQCFWEVAETDNYWEGDVRGNEMFIGAVPDPENVSCVFFVAFKQDNNGTSFIVSEVPLSHIENCLCIEPRNKFNIARWRSTISKLCHKLFPYNKPVTLTIPSNTEESNDPF